MTNEEAIEALTSNVVENPELMYEALELAIKALEQMPSEDCISREEAIRLAEQGQIQGYEWQFKKLCTLPSVTPQPKMGHWNILGDIWECSRCETMVMGYDGLNYCPNCGADMRKLSEQTFGCAED